MAVEKIVLDASVVSKWYLLEKHSDMALRFRNAHISGNIMIAAPILLLYEALNALRYSGVYTKDELVKVAESLSKYGLELWGLTDRLTEEAVRLSFDYAITIYDATYVALALILKTSLYTADEGLVRKLRPLNVVKHISEGDAV
ncbi:MAG: type II toxin-antitoxin system VapC family toxin [Candidatus Bathyarchaeia archaeon]